MAAKKKAAKKAPAKKKAEKKEEEFTILKVRDVLDGIEEQMEEAELDVIKWDREKNRSSGARLRKTFEGVRKQLKALRKNIQTKKNLDKAEKKAVK